LLFLWVGRIEHQGEGLVEVGLPDFCLIA
jgi:hypothetical protein